ncbi:DNAJ domain-containing protein Scj1 [Schizosaccharomyces octosporus yFS286]|uniref:DNAJ domain-containing protein Scj1 n=1 Tax=Schizosaccharomyces octosporus (strain yFS286) TaxID=483514 RepID=S9PUS5_SCHOY|nr:DNAJ domain-containing protein Scj1 [Schizosaccharomyces octosporus yFS286]EPX71268.1 DNAJ domain-containing protein Scj1 [Schizosaccharomyces octosporus yFS286]
MHLNLLHIFIGLFLCFQTILAAADFYKVLGVGKDASEADIKKAYRQLTKQWHPDKNPGNEEAQEKFIEINKANEVLSDPERRKIYDAYGEEGLNGQPRGGPGGGGFPGGGFGFDPFADIFENMFGGRRRQNAVRRGPSIEQIAKIDLASFYSGGIMEVEFPVKRICHICHGKGYNPKYSEDKAIHSCPICDGVGFRVLEHMIAPGFRQQMRIPCDACGGRGRSIKHRCPHCKGERVAEVREKFTVEVPAGAPQDFRVTFSGKSDEIPGIEVGDIVIILQEAGEQDGWIRKGNDLFRKETISYQQALLGNWKKKIRKLDGSFFEIKRSSGEVIHPGQTDRIKNQGMPIYNTQKGKTTSAFGNAFIEWEVRFPKKLKGKFLKELNNLFSKYEDSDEL